MTRHLAVLDPDPATAELFHQAGRAADCTVTVVPRALGHPPSDLCADISVAAAQAFRSDDERRAYLMACAPDSVVLIVQTGEELGALSTSERERIAGIAAKPLGGPLARAYVEELCRRHDEQKRKDAALRAIPDVFFRISRDHRYVDCQPRDHDSLVYAPEAFLGRHIADVLPADLAAETASALDRALATGAPQTFCYELEHRDRGETRHYEARLAASGADEVVVLVRDVTATVRAQRALERTAAMKQALASRILHVQEKERRHLAHELHDAIGQMLLVHKLDAEWLRTRSAPGELHRASSALAKGLEETLELVRSLARGLRPPALDDLGLSAALDGLAYDLTRHTPCRIHASHELPDSALPAEVSVTLYRIAQEAITNAIKHGRCENIWITLRRGEHGEAVLRIEDDGTGIDQDTRPGSSLGLLGMHERAVLHDGAVSVSAGAAGGTAIEARIPNPTEATN